MENQLITLEELEVGDEILVSCQSHFKYLQETFKVEKGLKGKEVEASKLIRDNILNGMGVNVIHFENFIKRFYGNRKKIYGFIEDYNFNPADAFFRNNALKDTKDWS